MHKQNCNKLCTICELLTEKTVLKVRVYKKKKNNNMNVYEIFIVLVLPATL